MGNSTVTFERDIFEANISGSSSFKLSVIFPYIYLFLSLFTLFVRITPHLSTILLLLWAFSPALHFSYISRPSFRILKPWKTSLFCTFFHSTKFTLPDFSLKSQYHVLLYYCYILSLAFVIIIFDWITAFTCLKLLFFYARYLLLSMVRVFVTRNSAHIAVLYEHL